MARRTQGADPVGRVLEVRYIHDDDGEPYKHEFRPGVKMEALPDGSLRIYKPGSRVWSDL